VVLLYHGSRLLLMHSLPFPWPINYNHAFWCNESSTHSLSIWFRLKIFFFLWNYGIAYGHVLQASKCTSEWKIAFRIISRFYIDTTSLWWESWTARNVHSSWSWTLSNLVLLHFFELLHLGDFVASQLRF
jgi:hypothetical protein